MKTNLIASILLASSFSLSVSASEFEKRNFIEDLAAVMAAKYKCGFQTNKRMISLSYQAVNMSPTDLLPGGKLRDKFLHNISHIEAKTQMNVERKAFCNSVRTHLGALVIQDKAIPHQNAINLPVK